MNLKAVAVVVSLVLSVGSLVFYAGVLYGDMKSAEEAIDRHEKAIGTVDARIEEAIKKVRESVQVIRDIVGECCKGIEPNPIPQPMYDGREGELVLPLDSIRLPFDPTRLPLPEKTKLSLPERDDR